MPSRVSESRLGTRRPATAQYRVCVDRERKMTLKCQIEAKLPIRCNSLLINFSITNKKKLHFFNFCKRIRHVGANFLDFSVTVGLVALQGSLLLQFKKLQINCFFSHANNCAEIMRWRTETPDTRAQTVRLGKRFWLLTRKTDLAHCPTTNNTFISFHTRKRRDLNSTFF
jgi:hypothetical protein